MIDAYICFYNHERIQTKTGVAPLTLRHSAQGSVKIYAQNGLQSLK